MHSEELNLEMQEQGAGGAKICSELLGADNRKVDNARHNVTTPQELLEAVWLNLKLESLELHPTRRPDGVLSV